MHQPDQPSTMSSASAPAPPLTTTPDFEIMTEADIQAAINRLVNQLKDAIQLPSAICYLLLRHSRWDYDMTAQKFFDAVSNLEPEMCGAFDPANPTDEDSVINSSKRGQCTLCENDDVQIHGLNCQHLFCAQCWSFYIKHKVVRQGTSIITCPELRCNVFLDSVTVLRMIDKEPALRRQYERLELRYYIATSVYRSKLLKPCPGLGCLNYALGPLSSQNPRVNCTCGYAFCWECGNSWHEPICCELLTIWLKRCNKDYYDTAWIRTFTKACPKCQISIEKSQGCNHIICRACRHQFCWTCMNDWKIPHGIGSPYKCKLMAQKQEEKKEEKAEDNTKNLDHLLFYAGRYENHARSIRMEHRLRRNIEEKLHEYQAKSEDTFLEAIFLREAIDALTQARHVLQYSYAFAFFLEPNQTLLTIVLEDNQNQLEMPTEELSNLLERNEIEASDKEALKTEIVKLTRHLQQRTTILLEHVYERTRKAEWRYSAELLDGSGLKVGTMEWRH